MIKLNDDLVITADEYQYIVGRPRQRADKIGGQVIWIDNPSYYSTIAGALKEAVAGAMRKSVANGNITTLHDFLVEQQRLQEDFAKLVEPLNV